MTNPWKLTTIALAVTIVTALTSGLTTAYLRGQTLTSQHSADDDDPRRRNVGKLGSDPVEPRRAPIVRVARVAAPPPAPRPVEPVTPAPVAAAPVSTGPVAEAEPEPAAPAPQAEPAVAAASPAVTTPVPVDCATGGDRAWRIAKPGAIGTLVGAGVGAAGGAIADGGSGAGKGALWGGAAGAALGSAWGAYKTHQECGTIFGR